MARPQTQDYPEAFHRYIAQTVSEDPIDVLEDGFDETMQFFKTIPTKKQEYAYAPGKWTLKEMLQHIIDCERIFNFRALAFARGEKQSLPGFEEDKYAENSFGNNREWKDLCDEFLVVRKSTIFLYKSFTKEALLRSGISNEKEMTVNAVAFAIGGHEKHHIGVINERYL